MPTFRLRIDGQSVAVHSEAETPLLHALRPRLRMDSHCGLAQCRACVVYVDGEPVRSCVLPLSEAAGKSVTTRLSRA